MQLPLNSGRFPARSSEGLDGRIPIGQRALTTNGADAPTDAARGSFVDVRPIRQSQHAIYTDRELAAIPITEIMPATFRVISVVIPLLVALHSDPAARGQRGAQLLACETTDSRGKCTLFKASIAQLLARPEAFDGKRVRVTGFIHFEFEGNGIYLHREDYEKHLYANGLWVVISPSYKPDVSCQDRHVLIEGLFKSSNHGHMGLWSGAIMEITRCMKSD